MKTSAIAVFSSAENPMEVRQEKIPDLKEGELLVRNEYTTLCRSDLNTFSGKRTEKTPTILGHEIVGRIAAKGPEGPSFDLKNQNLQIDDRITWAIYASDPLSAYAEMGIPQKGEDLFKYGHEQITPTSTLHGGLSEYTVLRRNTPIVKVNTAIPLEVLAIINCAVATVAGAVRLAGNIQGKNVLISGVGMLGIVACAMCRAFGADKIIAVDINEERINMAKIFSADLGLFSNQTVEYYKNSLSGAFDHPLPIHKVLEFSGVATAMETTLQLLDIGGTAVWVGATYPEKDLSINAEYVVRNLLTIRGLHNYNQKDLVTAVDFVEAHYERFPLKELVKGGFSLDRVNEAFDFALTRNPFRVGIKL